MDIQLILFLIWTVSVLAILAAFIWIAIRLGNKKHGPSGNQNNDQVFDEDFRARLRERGVARFEHTLDQQAAFLQHDLHAVSDEVSEFIKERAAEILKEEFVDQKQTIAAAQQHLSEVFTKLDAAAKEYQQNMAEQFSKELLEEKQRRLARFEQNMADVVMHHVQQTLSSHMEVSEQVKFIIDNLESNKTAIVEDIKREF